MQRPFRGLAAIVSLLLAGAGLAHAQQPDVNARIDTLLGDHAEYERVVKAFQAAVIGRDAAAAAALVRYPLTVERGGRRVTLHKAQDLVAHYDTVVTPAIAQVVKAQRYDALFVNAQGVMFGHGEVWVNGSCLDTACKKVDVKVTAIQEVATK